MAIWKTYVIKLLHLGKHPLKLSSILFRPILGGSLVTGEYGQQSNLKTQNSERLTPNFKRQAPSSKQLGKLCKLVKIMLIIHQCQRHR